MYILSFVIFAAIALVAIVLVTGYWMLKHQQLTRKMQTLSMEVAKANDEARAAGMVKDIFIKNMSHQIRTPLHAINGFAQLLATTDNCLSDEDKAEFASHIRRNTTVLTMLFDDMLSIVDIECGKFGINITKTRVNETVQEVLETFEHMVNDSVEMTYETAVSDDFTIETDSQRLKQLLMNLISNSIKHTEKGFIKVEFSISQDGKNANFSVTDSGEGVPKEMAKAIFARFKKLNEFTEGNGLGLSLCEMIAKKLHGMCYLDTTYPGEEAPCIHGARFIFTSPVKQPTCPPSAP